MASSFDVAYGPDWVATETVGAEDEVDVVKLLDNVSRAGQGRFGAECAPLLEPPVHASEEPGQSEENEEALADLRARVTRVDVLLHRHDTEAFEGCQKHCKHHSDHEPRVEPPTYVRVLHAFDLESRDLERLVVGHSAHELPVALHIIIVRVQAHVAGDQSHIEQQTFNTRVLYSLQAFDVRTHILFNQSFYIMILQ